MASRGFMHDRRSAATSDEWYTPPEVFEALGLAFDLDPAAPVGGVPWIPATRHFSKREDGLTQDWRGQRIWLNPPYGRATAGWLDKLADHGDGLALVYARTDTRWFQRFAAEASALCFVRGRLHFRRPDGSGALARAPSLLVAFGLPCAIALAESDLGRTLIVPKERSKA